MEKETLSSHEDFEQGIFYDIFSFYEYNETIFLLLFLPSVCEYGAWQFSWQSFCFCLKTWN